MNLDQVMSDESVSDVRRAIAKNEALNLGFRLVKLYSVKTGLCAENCAFCGQSGLAKKESKVIKTFPPIWDIYLAVEDAKRNLASEILFVSSGTRLFDKNELEVLAKGIVRSRDEGLEVGIDLGLMDYDSLLCLFDAGANVYVNAVQTARSLFPEMITSHAYEDHVQVLENARKIGYSTRSGGILGLGETEEQRREFALELENLPCDTVGLSLFQPIKGSVMENHPKMSSLSALSALAFIRNVVDKPIYLLGGREKVISKEHMRTTLQLVNGTTVGDYLFTKGEGIEELLPYIPNKNEVPRK